MIIPFLPDYIPMPTWLLLLLAFIIIGIVAFAGFVMLFAMQIPDVKDQIIAQMKRRALVLVHYSNRRAKFYCPKRKGKKQQENTLTLPDSMGTKFDPSGQGLEEVVGKTIMYNMYTKSTNSITPTEAKAVHDFRNFCGEKGIEINEELIDALVVENLDIQGVYTQPLLDRVLKNLPLPIRTEKERWLDEETIVYEENRLHLRLEELNEALEKTTDKKEVKAITEEITNCNAALNVITEKYNELDTLKETKQELVSTMNDIEQLESHKSALIDKIDILSGFLDPDTRQRIYTLTKLKEDLQQMVIRDGLFVFPKVHEFVFAASALTAAGTSEAISIAKADAINQNMKDGQGFTMEGVAMIAIILVIVLVGGGLAYKMAFG